MKTGKNSETGKGFDTSDESLLIDNAMYRKIYLTLLIVVTITIFGCGNIENEAATSEVSTEMSVEEKSAMDATSSDSNKNNQEYSTVYANRYNKDSEVFVSDESGFYDNMAVAVVDTKIAASKENNSLDAVRRIWNERIIYAADNIRNSELGEEDKEKLDEILRAWEKYDEEIMLMDKGLYGTNGIVPGSMYKDMLSDYVMTDYELIGGAFLSWEYELLGKNSMKLVTLDEKEDLSSVNWSDFSEKEVVMEYDSDFADMISDYNPEKSDDKDYYSYSKEICSWLDDKTGSMLGYEQYIDDYYSLICSMADFEGSIVGNENAAKIKTIRMKFMFLKLSNAEYLMRV